MTTGAGEHLVLTIEEAAERLCIGRTLMYSLVKAGAVESVRIGRLRRVPGGRFGRIASAVTAPRRRRRRLIGTTVTNEKAAPQPDGRSPSSEPGSLTRSGKDHGRTSRPGSRSWRRAATNGAILKPGGNKQCLRHAATAKAAFTNGTTTSRARRWGRTTNDLDIAAEDVGLER